MIEFSLPIRAVSQNTFWDHRPPKGIKFITNMGRAWREEIQWLVREQIVRGNITPYTSERLSVVYRFYFKGKRRLDVANFEKPLTDSLEGYLFRNDSQFDEVHLYVCRDCKKDRIEIQIQKIPA